MAKEGYRYEALLQWKKTLELQIESLKTQLNKKETKLIEVTKRIRTIESE